MKENIYKLRANLDDERLNKEDKFNAKIKELSEIEYRFTATIETEVKVCIVYIYLIAIFSNIHF